MSLDTQHYVAEHLPIEKWIQWAVNDGMDEAMLSNMRSWSQQQLLDLAEQIHREKLEDPPDPQRYPESVGHGEEFDAKVRRQAEEGGISFQNSCLISHRMDCQKFVLSFRPHELEGKTWKQLRRSKGPLAFWC